ncbi:MAG TPA: CdaR family protein [Thermoanaerobaculia bacterium]|nr:CdaR family protein [Thermoanaerobaculia bacterium]
MRLFGNLNHNLTIKIVALLLAVLTWGVISAQRRERTFERGFDVPIALVGVPRDLIVTTPLPESISVRLRGRISVLRALSSQNLESTLDLSNSDPGEVDIAITPQQLNIPAGVEVVSIDPSRVTLRLEGRKQRLVPIRPYLVGELPQAYEVGEVTVSPEHALISGPESLIRDFTEVVTERIILSGRTTSFRQPVGLVADHPLVRVVEPSTAQVTVVVTQEPRDPGPLEDEIGSAAGQPGR